MANISKYGYPSIEEEVAVNFGMTKVPVGSKTRPRKPRPIVLSWYCHNCSVEVYERRCPHCGKLEHERA